MYMINNLNTLINKVTGYESKERKTFPAQLIFPHVGLSRIQDFILRHHFLGQSLANSSALLFHSYCVTWGGAGGTDTISLKKSAIYNRFRSYNSAIPHMLKQPVQTMSWNTGRFVYGMIK